jgi:hypothetical protein
MAKITAYPLRTVPEATDRFILADPESSENYGIAYSDIEAAVLAAIPPAPPSGAYREPMSVFNNNSPEILFNGRGEVVTSYVA